MEKIRVLVIDDSAFMRKIISEILASDHRIRVVGTARNGQDGLEKIKTLHPDVITLDIEMPVLDGITTLKEIMKTNPLPVIMVSSVSGDEADKTIKAISKGAVDFIAKPSGPISLNMENVKDEVISKVITASQAKVSNSNRLVANQFKKDSLAQRKKTIIAIGTSTGGPKALMQLLADIPEDFPAPILIVQHMPANFTKSLAKRLDQLAKITVKEATHGEVIQSGYAYIAPGDYHMVARQVERAVAIELTKEPSQNIHRPSVDTLFKSLAPLHQYNKIATILTGMGRDGAKGITYLKEKDENLIVLTESKQSALIYGMPRAVKKTGYVNMSVHIERIGKVIEEIVRQNNSEV